eukprot:m.136530 g.136530  ORF g.136530 m.136530 type:complete len:383 (-) comp22630_c0_seq2:215-1363(-)
MSKAESRSMLETAGLLGIWWSSSVGSNVFLKKGMKTLPQPLTASIFQLLVLVVVLRGYSLIGSFRPKKLQRRGWILWITPLAALKLMSSLSTQFSLANVPLSYTHTVKATLPLFSVAFSWLLLGQTFSLRVLASLVPIVVGVIIASATELEFNLAGLLSALASVMVAAGQTVFVKGVLKQREIDTLSLLLFTSEIALLGLGPVWWWVDGANLLSASTAGDETGDGLLWPQQKTALQWLACAGVLNTVQTISAFAYLNSVSPVSYSVANVSKRILVIFLAMVIFGRDFHVANCVGITITLLGVALYNREKLRHQGNPKFQVRNSEASLDDTALDTVVTTYGAPPMFQSSAGDEVNIPRHRDRATPVIHRRPLSRGENNSIIAL